MWFHVPVHRLVGGWFPSWSSAPWWLQQARQIRVKERVDMQRQTHAVSLEVSAIVSCACGDAASLLCIGARAGMPGLSQLYPDILIYWSFIYLIATVGLLAKRWHPVSGSDCRLKVSVRLAPICLRWNRACALSGNMMIPLLFSAIFKNLVFL